jgi:hypothetical protein
MTTIYVVHDEFGQILSIVMEGGDMPVAGPGENVTELSVSGEMEHLEVYELSRRFHVDVSASQLVEGPIEAPLQD